MIYVIAIAQLKRLQTSSTMGWLLQLRLQIGCRWWQSWRWWWWICRRWLVTVVVVVAIEEVVVAVVMVVVVVVDGNDDSDIDNDEE